MKKKKDKIERLVQSYKLKSAKRIAKAKKEEEVIRAEVKARPQFEKNFNQKMAGVFGPVFKELYDRLDKKLFILKTGKPHKDSGAITYYGIDSRDEGEEVYFAMMFYMEDEVNEVRFEYIWASNGRREKFKSVYMNAGDITPKLIRNTFMRLLEKICN